MKFDLSHLSLAEVVEFKRSLEAQGLTAAPPSKPIDPRPILVRWDDMPLSYVGPDGLDWERVKDFYTSRQEDDDGQP